ncbi:MAG TPA: pentapeptide repeat-containing protein [Spongiibacteraceae bacterium]|nr:pentapeptide repeat-containing protein [Spongiibacteraceae bacterium]
MNENIALIEHKKDRIEDKEFSADTLKASFSQNEFIRVYAVKKTFEDVDFSQCSFTACYFRNCKFIRCNFTGSQFKETYLKGSRFPESIFKYTTFEKSPIDDNILETGLPSEENLARDVVRSLRINFSQTGDYEAVNKAISIEVSLTGIHLYNAAYSKQSYYRGKESYSGFNRLKFFAKHAAWKFLDLLWGNGESIPRIIFSSICFMIFIAVMIYAGNHNTGLFGSFLASVYSFWGVNSVLVIPAQYTLLLTISRLVFFSLFISVLIKRLARR